MVDSEPTHSFHEGNVDQLREIQRNIVSAIIVSSDNKILLGRKDPKKGGVYPDAWHIPGGGVEEGETLSEALDREIGQEVVGLNLTEHTAPTQLPEVGSGSSRKTLPTGETVWCNMAFNRFVVRLDTPSTAFEFEPGDDLVELVWAGEEELQSLEQIPGSIDLTQFLQTS